MKLSLFIPSLETGGAERQMILLAEALQKRGHAVSLWTLRGTGAFLSQVQEAGIRHVDIAKGGRYDLVAPAWRLRKICAEEKPDAVISCLPSSNLYALSIRILGLKTALIWGLASAKLPVGEYGWWAKISYFVQARLARWVDRVVVNSVAGRDSAREEGYPISTLQVIHNGVDMNRFLYSAERGRRWRREMGIPEEAKLIGMVGRLDPAKDYETFLRVCEIADEKANQGENNLWFVIVGGGDNPYANELREKIHRHPLYRKRLLHKENETDMVSVYSALDMMTLTSKSEGLPNTIVEALACERLCVVTDVGDCRLAVDRFGRVCEVGDAKSIASAWCSQLEDVEKPESIAGLRDYMEANFSLEKMVKDFEQVCEQVLGKRSGHG